jgi:TPR repeat protein
MLYLTGAGVPRDQDEATKLFRVAADGGDAHSHVDLGNLLLKGHGDEQDSVRTREWFEKAAESGDLIAAFNFGVCLAEGVGIERDDRKAAEWLRRAADGVVNAQYWYGRMLVDGRGVAANPEEGRKWIAKAAGVGMVDAEVMLAEMTLSGPSGSAGAVPEGGRSRSCRRDVRRRCDVWRRP